MDSEFANYRPKNSGGAQGNSPPSFEIEEERKESTVNTHKQKAVTFKEEGGPTMNRPQAAGTTVTSSMDYLRQEQQNNNNARQAAFCEGHL